MRRFSLLLGGVIVLVAIAFGYSRLNTVQTTASYRLETVERGTIEKTISSTGRVKPVMTVEIGSQVSGQISEVLVDFNSKVKAGEIIARIDASPFEARVQVARADLAFAEANIAMQTAALEELQAELLGLQAILVEMAEDLERPDEEAAGAGTNSPRQRRVTWRQAAPGRIAAGTHADQITG